MKGLTCTDVQKQHKNAVSGDAILPTVYTDSVLITATINEHEECDVGICKILVAFISVDMDKDMKMVLRGRLAEKW